MSDTFRETTHESWFSRIKSAVGGIVVGLIMFLVAFPLTWWNEGRAVKQTRSLEEGEGVVLSVPAERIDPANEGKLVHVAGHVGGAALADDDFGLALQSLGLRRRVEMYQWHEDRETKEKKKLGGGTERETVYTYERKWDDDLVDSGDFRQSAGHANPDRFPVDRRSVFAEQGRLGAFVLGRDILEQIDEWRGYDVPAGATPTVPGFRQAGDGFYLGADPAAPEVGDVRVRFQYVPEGDYSFVAQQAGQGLAGYQTRAGNGIMLIAAGTKSAPEMFAAEHRKNTLLTWLLRGAGFALMWLGLSLMLRPIAVVADVVPLFGSIVGMGIGFVAGVVAFMLAMSTIALAWVFYRPVLGVLLLTTVVGGVALLVRRRHAARAKAVPAHAVPPPPPPGLPQS